MHLQVQDEKRFEVTFSVTPKAAGDFGSIKIGGVYRTLNECQRFAESVREQILEHVNAVDTVHYDIYDVYQEIEDISDWKFNQKFRGKNWQEQLELFEPKQDIS